ncbi:hypothetical protein KC853_01145 [Candidatus Saccharibacteria bacterium]|nr:hypothetical protein [Candidatus Saccharibacteria bacterium]MCB9834826.1 hypothetical protein [Candidatus Nomurabacteria bacterium]
MNTIKLLESKKREAGNKLLGRVLLGRVVAMALTAATLPGCSFGGSQEDCSPTQTAQVPGSQEIVSAGLLDTLAEFLGENPTAFDNQDPEKLLGLDQEGLKKVGCEDLLDNDGQLTELGQKLAAILSGYEIGLSAEQAIEAHRLGIPLEYIIEGKRLGIPFEIILDFYRTPATFLD